MGTVDSLGSLGGNIAGRSEKAGGGSTGSFILVSSTFVFAAGDNINTFVFSEFCTIQAMGVAGDLTIVGPI